MADTTHFGILRIIVDHPEEVERVLKDAGLTVSITSVITACIHNRPGGLAEVLKLLSTNDIQIEYMYAFIAKDQAENEGYLVMRIEAEDAAVQLLEKNGYTGMES